MIDYANDIRIHLMLCLLTRIKGNNMTTEVQKQQFVYDLAKLNSLATKGYMAERTAIDDSIYAIKQLACEYIATHWPSRCRYDSGYSCTAHSSVLYIYVKSRQYSFHVDLSGDIVVNKARFNEWDHLVGGWELSDKEYRKARDASRKKVYHIATERSPETRSRVASYLVALKDYIRRRDAYLNHYDEAHAKFWQELALALPRPKQKNKCYVNKDFDECYRRYFSLIASSFSLELKQVFRGAPYFDYKLVDHIRHTCSNGISLLDDSTVQTTLRGMVDAHDKGQLKASTIYKLAGYGY